MKRFQKWLYTFLTNDKYSDFDSRQSFNRVNNASSEVLFSHNNVSTTGLMAPERDSSELAPANQATGIHEVRLAWRHIKLWVLKNFPEVESTLQSPCTDADLAEVQKDLRVVLPNCVLEFYRLTDGQEFLSGAVGLVYGLRLLPIDQVVVETENWRKVVESMPQPTTRKLLLMSQAHQSDVDLTSDLADDTHQHTVKRESQPLVGSIPHQHSVPPGAIHECFAHNLWIPLVTDGVGNCIGIDLAPPANGPGVYGQVILFGREFDTKYQVADNWGDFLLIFANDLENGHWTVKLPVEDMDNGDLLFGSMGKLVYCERDTGDEVGYFEVLKRRAMKLWLSSIDESKQSELVKLLIRQFRQKKTMLVPLRGDSVDDVIRNNLASLVTSENESKDPDTAQKVNSESIEKVEIGTKSPLSKEVECDLADISKT